MPEFQPLPLFIPRQPIDIGLKGVGGFAPSQGWNPASLLKSKVYALAKYSWTC
jgi:hypothetical protein